MASVLQVAVNSAAGQLLHLEAQRTATVSDLKAQISGHWHIPAMCQKLVFGLETVNDALSVGQLCDQGRICDPCTVLNITMTVCLQLVCDCLQHENSRNVEQQASAVEALVIMALHGSASAMDELASTVQADPNRLGFMAALQQAFLKKSALDALNNISAQQHRPPIVDVILALSSQRNCEASAPIQTLTDIVPQEDKHTINGLIIYLKCCCTEHEKESALKVLAKIVQNKDERITDALVHCLERLNRSEKCQCVEALAKAASHEAKLDMAVVTSCLEHESPDCRLAAIDVLSKVPQQDPDLTAAVIPSLIDHLPYVRQAAVETLAQIARQGDVVTVTALIASMDDQDCNVRKAALAAVAKVSEAGDKQAVIAAIARRLNDENDDVRGTAAKVLAMLEAQAHEAL